MSQFSRYYAALQHERGVLWEAVFAGSPAGVLDVTRFGLMGSRNSVATGQTGTSTIKTDYAINEMRSGRRLDSDQLGLIFEALRTQFAFNNTDFNAGTWLHTDTTVTPSAETGPDGVAGSATRLQTGAGASAGAYQSTFGSTFGAVAIGSVWVKRSTAAGGSGNSQIMLADSGVTSVSKAGLVTATQAWQRQVVGLASPAALALYLAENADRTAIGGGVPGATDNVYFLPQWETGRFVSEAIVNTTGASVARAGERLWHPAIESIRDGQTFAVSVLFKPKGSSSDYGVNGKIWSHNSATTYVEWNRTTRVVTFVIGGVSYSTAGTMTWSQYDDVEIFVAVNSGAPAYAAYRVNGGAWTKLSTGTPPTLVLGTPTGAVDLWGDRDTGAGATPGKQTSAWLYAIKTWRAGHRPAGTPD